MIKLNRKVTYSQIQSSWHWYDSHSSIEQDFAFALDLQYFNRRPKRSSFGLVPKNDRKMHPWCFKIQSENRSRWRILGSMRMNRKLNTSRWYKSSKMNRTQPKLFVLEVLWSKWLVNSLEGHDTDNLNYTQPFIARINSRIVLQIDFSQIGLNKCLYFTCESIELMMPGITHNRHAWTLKECTTIWLANAKRLTVKISAFWYVMNLRLSRITSNNYTSKIVEEIK